jgi:hypothetical protein
MLTFALLASLIAGVPTVEIEDTRIVPAMWVGPRPCGPWTPVGSSCMCNHYVVRKHAKPGWIAAFRDGGTQRYARPGWHFTNSKGMHSSGDSCYHDS